MQVIRNSKLIDKQSTFIVNKNISIFLKIYAKGMPILPDLFWVYTAGNRKVRYYQRRMAWN